MRVIPAAGKIAPGVAHRDTITTFHNAFRRHTPRADNCILDGPLHLNNSKSSRCWGTLAVNTVIDEHRQLSFVNSGSAPDHLVAVDLSAGTLRSIVPRRFKTVVTSAAGYLLDKTYYQTVRYGGSDDILEPEVTRGGVRMFGRNGPRNTWVAAALDRYGP
jgi:nickel-dependent lactate racemase